MMAGPRWTLCPRCGSFELHGEYWSLMGQRHACKDCGYKGSFVIEADSQEEALRLQEEIHADYEAREDGDDGPAEGSSSNEAENTT